MVAPFLPDIGIDALDPIQQKNLLVIEGNLSGPDGKPDDKVDLYDFAALAESWTGS